MDCPACKEPMVVLELSSVEIDHCINCSGIWLDAGELEILLESTEKKDAVLNSFGVDGASREIRRKCPICMEKMDKILCGKDKKILIDRCAKNHGIWFDKEELHNIITMGGLDKNNKILTLLKDMFGEKSAENMKKGG